MSARQNRLLDCREQAAGTRQQQNKQKVLHRAMNLLNTAVLWQGHVKTYNWLSITTAGNYLCKRKWPWQFYCATQSKAVTETDKQKWQPYCESVICLPVACVFVCLLLTGHSRRLWQLPEGSFMMTALIFSCKITSVLEIFPNMVCTASGNCHRTLTELLRGLMRYCSVKAIFLDQ